MKRGQDAFEYVLLLAGILLRVDLSQIPGASTYVTWLIFMSASTMWLDNYILHK